MESLQEESSTQDVNEWWNDMDDEKENSVSQSSMSLSHTLPSTQALQLANYSTLSHTAQNSRYSNQSISTVSTVSTVYNINNNNDNNNNEDDIKVPLSSENEPETKTNKMPEKKASKAPKEKIQNKSLGGLCRVDEEHEDFRTVKVTKSFSMALQKARVKKGWNQQKLAQQLNVRAVVINQCESGKTVPNPQLIAKMNRVLGVKLPQISNPRKKNKRRRKSRKKSW